jgi:hypothetical protein
MRLFCHLKVPLLPTIQKLPQFEEMLLKTEEVLDKNCGLGDDCNERLRKCQPIETDRK